MTEPFDSSQYTSEEIELAKRVMCAHISMIKDKSYEECWNLYIEPAERIEKYYLAGTRFILKNYADAHKQGAPQTHTSGSN